MFDIKNYEHKNREKGEVKFNETKYRALDKYDKWREGYMIYAKTIDIKTIRTSNKITDIFENEYYMVDSELCTTEIDPFTIGMSTNFYDKYNTEIFEGDIVEIKQYAWGQWGDLAKGEVVFENGSWMVKNTIECNYDVFLINEHRDFYEIKIIGNKYQGNDSKGSTEV